MPEETLVLSAPSPSEKVGILFLLINVNDSRKSYETYMYFHNWKHLMGLDGSLTTFNFFQCIFGMCALMYA